MGVSYIPVARAGELTPGGMKEVDLGGRPVLLAFVEGKYFAFSRQCPHEEADLKSAGQLLGGGKIRCNNHSYCYDLASGECTLPRGAAPLRSCPPRSAAKRSAFASSGEPREPLGILDNCFRESQSFLSPRLLPCRK